MSKYYTKDKPYYMSSKAPSAGDDYRSRLGLRSDLRHRAEPAPDSNIIRDRM
jgi:hypothetical protein